MDDLEKALDAATTLDLYLHNHRDEMPKMFVETNYRIWEYLETELTRRELERRHSDEEGTD